MSLALMGSADDFGADEFIGHVQGLTSENNLGRKVASYIALNTFD